MDSWHAQRLSIYPIDVQNEHHQLRAAPPQGLLRSRKAVDHSGWRALLSSLWSLTFSVSPSPPPVPSIHLGGKRRPQDSWATTTVSTRRPLSRTHREYLLQPCASARMRPGVACQTGRLSHRGRCLQSIEFVACRALASGTGSWPTPRVLPRLIHVRSSRILRSGHPQPQISDLEATAVAHVTTRALCHHVFPAFCTLPYLTSYPHAPGMYPSSRCRKYRSQSRSQSLVIATES